MTSSCTGLVTHIRNEILMIYAICRVVFKSVCANVCMYVSMCAGACVCERGFGDGVIMMT